ncbi:MAG: flagellar protein FlaG [Pseudomonadota bacterium]
MSKQDLNGVASATGQFTALRPKMADAAVSGRVTPDSGKTVPVAQVAKPDLEAITKQLNIQSQAIGRDLRFKVDMASGDSVIQVLDRETGEIIREIPPEKAELMMSASGLAELRLFEGKA